MVERDGLENRCTRECNEGLSPAPSAGQDTIGGQTHHALEQKLWEKKLDAL